jgi:hypothetical protein
MNCALHTDKPALAYCRSCGKALCEICERDVQGSVFCEPCLAAKVTGAPAAGAVPPPRAPEEASPGLALFLGFIPGAGAFYNGQFLKGFVHVIVFATLIWLSDHGMGAFAGLLLMGWFFYMVFDAYGTAKARRYGLPIPDPIGLNAILEGREGTFKQRVETAGERMGVRMEQAAQNMGEHWRKAGGASFHGATGVPPPPPGAPGSGAAADPGAAPGAPAAGSAQSFATGPQGTYYAGPEGTVYSGPQGTYYQGPQGGAYVPPPREHSPVGAVVLIGLGVIFLLENLGWFSFHWVSHFWPMILIVIGIWLFARRVQAGR